MQLNNLNPTLRVGVRYESQNGHHLFVENLLRQQQCGSSSNSASKGSLFDLSNWETQASFMSSNAPGPDLLQTAGYYQPAKHLRSLCLKGKWGSKKQDLHLKRENLSHRKAMYQK